MKQRPPHKPSGAARTRTHARALAAITSLTLFLVMGCSSGGGPRTFNSPEEAVQELVAAVRAEDTARLRAIVGEDGRDIVASGDEVSDRHRRERFLTLYDQKHSISAEAPDSRTLVIGPSDWPFPVPVVRESQGWYFDSQVGREEIVNRRVGENELSAIQVCRAIADAQREYALRDPTGGGVHEYAQQFPSDEGKRNGLYWPASPGEDPSPLGELVAAAAEEGYRRKESGPTPYHGYYYRILKSQGPGAPGGALDYVVNGRMPLGFAVVAWPAEYGNSGIMTFLTGHDGVVYQKDLGDDTLAVVARMTAFDPGEGWKKADRVPKRAA